MATAPRDDADAGAAASLALRRFAAHLAAGELQAALHAASDACHAAPHLPQPHYAYGEASQALGDQARAVQAFAAAVQRAPTWPDAWISLGVARYRQGAIDDAKTAMRQALRHAPGHPVATANLGAFLRITGEAEAAEALLRDSLARAPDNSGARLNLAADLLQEERAADALALLDAAPALPDNLPTLRHWHLQRALALLQLGRPAEARPVLDALAALGPIPPELAPLWHWRLVLLALAERNLAVAGREAERMAATLAAMGPEAVPEHQIMAHYDLAKFWSGQNDHAAAFTGRRAMRCCANSSRSRARRIAPSSMPTSPCSTTPASPPARTRRTPIRRRCSSSACRAPAPRCASRSSPPTPRSTAPASEPRSAKPSRC
jgi:Flp pilus assembly protein TadD